MLRDRVHKRYVYWNKIDSNSLSPVTVRRHVCAKRSIRPVIFCSTHAISCVHCFLEIIGTFPYYIHFSAGSQDTVAAKSESESHHLLSY